MKNMFISDKQEPKYSCDEYGLYNLHTGKYIPEDEPVFLFRAKDAHALQALIYYNTLCSNTSHKMVVTARINDFRNFAERHADRLHEPDSPKDPPQESIVPTKLPPVNEQSRWRHTNGCEYTVWYIANGEAKNPAYVETVVYKGDNGFVWTRPLSDWHRSMTLIEDKWERKT